MPELEGIFRVVPRSGNTVGLSVTVGNKTYFTDSAQLSRSIATDPSAFDGKPVVFERGKDGRATLVREVGTTFKPIATTPQREAAASGNSKGRHRYGQGPGGYRDSKSGGGGQRQTGGQRHGGNSPQRSDNRGPKVFHNPYNFIPAPPRNVNDPDLGDHPAIDHDRFAPDRYSGVLRVRMRVETPLLVPDPTTVRESDGHKTFALRVDAEGRPLLPASSVRGMLRGAYEAITNSRFGRFSQTQHAARLAMRMEASGGLALVPARVEGGRFVLQTGDSQIGETKPNGAMYAAWLPRYQGGKLARHAPKYPDGRLPQHGDRVICWVESVPHQRGFSRWIVQAIVPHASGLTNPPGPRPLPSWKRIEGWVCITNANINRKHDERVFFQDGPPQVEPIAVSDDHRAMWSELIANYQAIHVDDLQKRDKKGKAPDEFLGSSPGETAWSRHVYTKADRELREGTLCYVRLDGARRDVTGVFPVMISRELHDRSPWDLLHSSLRPAGTIEEASPADRVFGWVHVDADRDSVKRGRRVASRALLRVGPVTCLTEAKDAVERFDPHGVPLAILSTPKPQQTRFYVAKSPRGEAQADGLTKKQAGYANGKGLRGRKVYPHHHGLPAGHWSEPMKDRTMAAGPNDHHQEYRRPRLNGNEQRDDQNRSVLGWVKPGATFTFDLHAHNLSRVELGALMWLLKRTDGEMFRFGGGKPLGFGSVHLALEFDDVVSGDEITDRYQRWFVGSGGSSVATEAIAAFEEAILRAYQPQGKQFADVPFIRAFLTAARGYVDALPVRYPRVTDLPNPAGEAFKWFVSNEKREYLLALPDLVSDDGFPVLPDPKPR
jgi:CRISPR-associated protein (TIGR03986 family)